MRNGVEHFLMIKKVHTDVVYELQNVFLIFKRKILVCDMSEQFATSWNLLVGCSSEIPIRHSIELRGCV